LTVGVRLGSIVFTAFVQAACLAEKEKKMNRSERVGMLKSPIVLSGAKARTGNASADTSFSKPLGTGNAFSRIFPKNFYQGTIAARLFARLIPVDVVLPFANGLGTYPRSRNEIKGGAKRNLN
jgi:hypothetical protein